MDIPDEIKEYVKKEIRKAMAFDTTKYGDTPTDALQLTPKKYVDANSGSPAGNNKEIQYNSSGVFGSDSDFTWNTATKVLTVSNDGQNSHLTIKGYVNGSPQIVSDKPLVIDADISQIFLGPANKPDVVIGDGGNLATTATHGFLSLPMTTAAPTGTPANLGANLIYDNINNDLYVYNSGWKKVHLA